MKTLSLIITCHNKADFIEKALLSVVNSNGCLFDNYEVIIIDDASSDGSDRIIADFISDRCLEKVFNLYRLDVNRGVSSARNYALNNANGKYVAFLDGDDTCSTDYFAQINSIISNHEPDLIITPFLFLSSHQKSFNARKLARHLASIKENLYVVNDIFALLANGVILGAGNVVVKHDLIGDIRYNINSNIYEDSEFWFDIIVNSDNKTIVLLDRSVYLYNDLRVESLSRSLITSSARQALPPYLIKLLHFNDVKIVKYRKRMVVTWIYNMMNRTNSWLGRVTFLFAHYRIYLANLFFNAAYLSPLLFLFMPVSFVRTIRRKYR